MSNVLETSRESIRKDVESPADRLIRGIQNGDYAEARWGADTIILMALPMSGAFRSRVLSHRGVTVVAVSRALCGRDRADEVRRTLPALAS